MALWLQDTISPIFQYRPYTGSGYLGIVWNPWLITPPRIYPENVLSIPHFFYEPSNDYIVAYIWFNCIEWPGFTFECLVWRASDFSFVGRATAGYIAGQWANHAGVGSYNKIYTTQKVSTEVQEVPWNSLWWLSGMWKVDPYTWTPPSTYIYAVVNREDRLFVGIAGGMLDVWDISGTPTRRSRLRISGPYLGYLTYENRDYCWIITSTGEISKANYRRDPPRWEMFSTVQDPTPDAINYLITFDTRRKRVIVLRQLPDAVDGACRSQFEIYYPMYKVVGLTDPVPVSRIRAGDKASFVAHLYGDNGEGVTPFVIDAEMTPPVEGVLLNPFSTSELNGSTSFRYQTPDDQGCEETLVLESTITWGE